ncbi:sepiapterin reductase-like [Apostichopus japonicus]|uniref:sepiapterin reductase-like n=1 Tax=Stichopus japonicus TaxID=307972 RepID=UPI003AB4A0AB
MAMAEEQKFIFNAPTVAFITGASKGIGRAIAVEFSKRFTDKLQLVLTGRCEKDLKETVSLIQTEPSFSSKKTTFKLVIGNLSDECEFTGLVDDFFNIEDTSPYQQAILINNAGSAGDAQYIRDLTSSDAKKVQEYFFLNVSSPLLLASKFLSVFSKSKLVDQKGIQHFIIQISSLAAVMPIPSWSLYCTGKAARDMLHRVIAAEEPDARVLCYAPGPVDTAMLHHMKDESVAPKAVKIMSDSHKVSVTPQKTASVLCDVLNDDKYESGAHIDIFDVIGPPKSD